MKKAGIMLAIPAIALVAGCGTSAAAASGSAKSPNPYGVPTAPAASTVTGSCQTETLFDLPQYKVTLTNPAPYDITVRSWNVTFHNKNGSSLTIPVTAENGITVSGSESWSVDKMMPDKLTYDYNGTFQTVAVSCSVSRIQ